MSFELYPSFVVNFGTNSVIYLHSDSTGSYRFDINNVDLMWKKKREIYLALLIFVEIIEFSHTSHYDLDLEIMFLIFNET